MNIFTSKLREVIFSVLPVVMIVFMIHFTLVPLSNVLFWRFLIGSLLMTLGLSIFLLGVDRGVTPLGNQVGESLLKTNKLSYVLIAGLILGFIISFAEPGLIIFGEQVQSLTSSISSTALLIIVSIGISLLLAFSFIKIIFGLPLYIILTILYLVVFILALFSQPEFLIIAFDASGATTGVLAVPFILALTFGISHLKKDGKASEKDSFGTIAIVSVGAIISVLFIGFFIDIGQLSTQVTNQGNDRMIPFSEVFISVITESSLAIMPLLLIFFTFQWLLLRLKIKAFIRILRGFIYTYIGLVIFLLGINSGFMDVGSFLGSELAAKDSFAYIVIIGFILGLVTILAEPAVHVLTKQIEEVTSGYVTKGSVMFALCIGVGLAVAMSLLRVFIEPLQIWHFLLPGYIIAIGLMYVVPKMFVGIAFDAGGVATGPMTATFILAFTQGAARSVDTADVILDGLGMIAMVALTPIITLQILGLVFKIKSRKGVL
mgnify:CR=1 FL=1